MSDDMETRLNVVPGDLSGIDEFEQRVPAVFKKAQVEGEAFFETTTDIFKEVQKLARAEAPEAIAREFARIAAESGNARSAMIGLQTELRKMDASDDEIKKAANAFGKEYTDAVKRASKETTTLDKELDKLARKQSLDQLAKEYAIIVQETGETTLATRLLQDQLEQISASDAEFKQVAASIERNLNQPLREAATQANKTDAAVGGITFRQRAESARFSRDNVGDLSTTFSAAASVGIGGEASRALSDVTGLAEYIPNFADAVKNAGLAASESTGLVGSIAASLAPKLGLVGGGLAAMALAAAPVVAIGIAVAAAFALISGRMDEARKSAEETGKRVAAEAAARAEVSQLIAEGNTEEIQNRLEAASAQKEVIEAQRAGIIALRDEAQARYDIDAARSPVLALDERSEIDAFNEQLKTFDEQLIPLEGDINAFSEAIVSAGFNAAISTKQLEEMASRQANIYREITTIAGSDIGTEELKQKVDELNAAYTAEVAIQEQLIALGLEGTDAYNESLAIQAQAKTGLEVYNSELVKNAAAVNDAAEAQKEFQEVMSAFAEETAQLDFDESLQNLRALRDETRNNARAEVTLNQQLQQQRESHFDKIEQIETAGLDKAEELRAQLAEGTDKAYQKIADTTTEANLKSAAEAAAYAKQRLRESQDFEREKARIEREGREEQFADILNNDITALIMSRRENAQELGDAEEEFGVEQTRSDEDFAADQVADQAATAEKVANIQAELTAYQAAVQAKIAANTLATQTQINKENEAYTAKLASDQAARDQQAAWRDEDQRIAEQDRAEDAALDEAARQKKLADDLAAIDSVEAKQAAATANALAGFSALEVLALRIKGAAEGIIMPVATPLGNAVENFNPVTGGGSTTAPVSIPLTGLPSPTASASQNFAPSPLNQPPGVNTGVGGGMTISSPITIQQVNVGELVGPAEAMQIATTIGIEVQKRVIQSVTDGIYAGQNGG